MVSHQIPNFHTLNSRAQAAPVPSDSGDGTAALGPTDAPKEAEASKEAEEPVTLVQFWGENRKFMYLQNFYALLIIIDLDTTVYKWLDIIVYNWMDRNIWDYNEIIRIFHRIYRDPDGVGVSLGSMGAMKIWKDPVVGSVQDLNLYHHWTQWIFFGPNLWQMWDDRWGQEWELAMIGWVNQLVNDRVIRFKIAKKSSQQPRFVANGVVPF